MFPVARLAAEVHDCNDEDEIFLDGVKNSVRKNVRDTATNVLVNCALLHWRLDNALNAVLN